MATVRLPIILLIVLVSAMAGATISYVFIPNADPEMKALLKRQAELAEEKAAARRRGTEATKRMLSSDPEQYPTSGGQRMKPRW